MATFFSTKLFSGYSACFRQWRATHSHCSLLHSYSVKFKVWFACSELDDKNWSVDFGSFKYNGIKEFLAHHFDHTLVLAKDDPNFQELAYLGQIGVARVIVLEDGVGCERFAQFVFDNLNKIIQAESNGRCWVSKVECFENDTNSAIFQE